jgi:site-specific DNA-adenine methylase
MATATATTPYAFRTARRFDLIVVSKKTGKEVERIIGSDQFDRIYDAIDSIRDCSDNYDMVLDSQDFDAVDLASELDATFDDYRHTVRFYNRRFPVNECPKCSENGEWSAMYQDRTHDREGNDQGMAMVCINCNHADDMPEKTPIYERLEDLPA